MAEIVDNKDEMNKMNSQNLQNMYKILKNEFEVLNLKLTMRMKNLAQTNNEVSQYSSEGLDEYLALIEEGKKKTMEYIKNADEIEDNFQAIKALGLKTDFLRTQIQTICLKNKISIE